MTRYAKSEVSSNVETNILDGAGISRRSSAASQHLGQALAHPVKPVLGAPPRSWAKSNRSIGTAMADDSDDELKESELLVLEAQLIVDRQRRVVLDLQAKVKTHRNLNGSSFASLKF